MAKRLLQWHPAFCAALRIELEEEADKIRIEEEHLLGEKPMQIDLLIIKKEKTQKIKKNIGQIFRTYNILEYKASDDYLSVNDFYKVYGYACFYQSQTGKVAEIDPAELTVTFVCSHYPRRMLAHVRNARGITARLREPGIYDLTGDPIAMQLIVTKRLSKENNFWLQNLRNDLRPGEEIDTLIERYREKKDKTPYQAVMDVVMRANDEKMEDKEMVPHEVWVEAARKAIEKHNMEIGEEKMGQLAEKLIANGRIPDVSRVVRDQDFRQKMYEEFGIDGYEKNMYKKQCN